METQTRLSRHNKFISAENITPHPLSLDAGYFKDIYIYIHSEVLRYNETVCLWMTIYTLPHGDWALRRRNLQLPLA